MALQALTQTKNLQLAEIAEDARANQSGLRSADPSCLLSAEEAFFWCALLAVADGFCLLSEPPPPPPPPPPCEVAQVSGPPSFHDAGDCAPARCAAPYFLDQVALRCPPPPPFPSTYNPHLLHYVARRRPGSFNP